MMKHTVLIAAAALLLACTTPAAAQTAVTEEVIREAEIIPDVIPAVNLDPKLRFALSFPSGDIDAGNLFSINASAAAPSVSISCNPGQCVVPRRTYYTLIMADPDAPSRENPIRRNIWHWGVTNAPNGRIAQGTAITTYRGPMPPMGVHRYVLMLFRQNGQISVPLTPMDGRANFNVTAFAETYASAPPSPSTGSPASPTQDLEGVLRDASEGSTFEE